MHQRYLTPFVTQLLHQKFAASLNLAQKRRVPQSTLSCSAINDPAAMVAMTALLSELH